MLNSDRSEVDVFFDSADSLSTDEPLVGQEELEIRELNFRVWLREPQSVEERRGRFLEKVGLLDVNLKNKTDESSELMGLERINERNDAPSSSLVSSADESEENLQFCGRDQSCGSNSMPDEEFEHENASSGVSLFNQECDNCEARVRGQERDSFAMKKKTKRWLKRFIGTMEKRKRNIGFELPKSRSLVTRVKVNQNKKNFQELSAVYSGQEIQGHDGFIWAMKFSTDGKYLASGGGDGVVRIWLVNSAEPSGRWFTNNMETGFKVGKSGYGRKKLNQASVFLPEKVFHIDEKPVQELRGHARDVLDLAWSNSNHLLSASMDKTVRLWQVGWDQCLGVFQHNNYVTCVQFNPTDKNYFISGSIDGKARIWGLSEERVVSFADVRDAVSAVCYQPDGQGFVVGSIVGTCRFYETSGNDVQLEAKIGLRGRKKTSANRITGVQFCPDKPKRLMVTSDDSKLRIFDGVKLLRKFKGLPKSGSQSSASFTSSAKHIVSVGQDRRVYVWNYNKPNAPSRKHVKSLRSCEYFLSEAVSVAVPWPGTTMARSIRHISNAEPLSRPCRVSATWPEEKLTVLRDENYNYTPEVGNLSEPWGLVIVTGGWDGTIRTFQNYGLPVRP